MPPISQRSTRPRLFHQLNASNPELSASDVRSCKFSERDGARTRNHRIDSCVFDPSQNADFQNFMSETEPLAPFQVFYNFTLISKLREAFSDASLTGGSAGMKDIRSPAPTGNRSKHGARSFPMRPSTRASRAAAKSKMETRRKSAASGMCGVARRWPSNGSVACCPTAFGSCSVEPCAASMNPGASSMWGTSADVTKPRRSFCPVNPSSGYSIGLSQISGPSRPCSHRGRE